jgi:hypothetical protein
MQAGSARSTRKLPPKLRLLTLDALDHRTLAARFARDLLRAITSDLGGEEALTAAQRELAQRAALLGAMCGDYEARWLSGDPIPLTDLLASVNVQRRCLSALGMERKARDVTSLGAILREADRERDFDG